jgi:hypothetical protein
MIAESDIQLTLCHVVPVNSGDRYAVKDEVKKIGVQP